jgi:nucleoside-diphosphate-sugar epimerase
MRGLILGRTGLLGLQIAMRLLASGHEVTVFHRGVSDANLPKGVSIFHGDRNRSLFLSCRLLQSS